MNFINKYFFEINFFFTKKLKYLFLFNFISGFAVNFFEIIGMGAIFYYIGIIISPFEYLSKYQNLYFVNYILNLDNSYRVFLLSIILVGIFWFKGIVIFLSNYIQNKFNFEFITDVSTRLFRHYMFRDYYFHLKNNPAILNQKIHNEINHVAMYFDWSLKFINSIMFITGIIIIFWFNSSYAGIINIFIISLIIFISRFFLKNRIKNKSELRSESDIELFKTLQHAFGSFIETVLFKKEIFFVNLFTRHLKKRETQTMYLNTINSLPKIFIEIFAITGLTAFFTIYYQSQQDVTKVLPFLVLITLAFIRLMPNLSVLLMSINQLNSLSYAKNSILQELKSIEPEKLKIDSKKTQINITFNKSIKIENLDFKYNKNSSEYILKNINLDINLGEKIAIVGESGAGKSTLVNVLTGLLRPESGRILVDGISVFESLKQWQNIISYIPQDIYLIDDTIEKNITFSTDKETYDKVWLDDVLRISNIYEEIYSLKENVNTLVGNRGIRFSGGQKQRIAIARAIYKKPKILIMDEPASGLDSENELSLIENILSQSKKITLVMISHNIDRHKEKFQVYKLKNKSLIKEI